MRGHPPFPLQGPFARKGGSRMAMFLRTKSNPSRAKALLWDPSSSPQYLETVATAIPGYSPRPFPSFYTVSCTAECQVNGDPWGVIQVSVSAHPHFCCRRSHTHKIRLVCITIVFSTSFSSVPAPKPMTKAQKKNTNRKLKKELGFYACGVVRAGNGKEPTSTAFHWNV